MFLTYLFIPLSVGMFPHLFQHWLTARSAKSFRLTVIAHPICIMVVWVPCVLIGAWATGLIPWGVPPAAVLSNILDQLIASPILTGLVTAGVLAAIMSSLDSQFLCLGTIFTNDIVLRGKRKGKIYRQAGHPHCPRLYHRHRRPGLRLGNAVDEKERLRSCGLVLQWFCLVDAGGDRGPLLEARHKAGAYASIFAAVLTWLYFFIKAGGAELTLAGGVMPVAICFAAGAVAMVVVSLMTKRPSDETIAKFFP